MATHDYVIANGTGAAVRSDLNGALAAIVSQNSSATEPSPSYAYQRWADTTAGVMKMRNGANNAWITLYQLDGEWSTIAFENGTAAAPSIYFKDSGTDTGIYSPGADQLAISTGGTVKATVDSSGRLLVGTSTAPSVGNGQYAKVVIQGSSHAAGNAGSFSLQRDEAASSIISGEGIAYLNFNDNAGNTFASIGCEADADAGASDYPGRLVFSTTADGAPSPTERLFITNTGRIGSIRNPDITWPAAVSVSGQNGASFGSSGVIATSSNAATCIYVDRNNADGDLIRFHESGTQEGVISVSGTTVTYGGGHLARWSQLPNDEDPSALLKGTVMSNLDEMCDWGKEDNEQLNKTKISDVEGDKNVAGVFVSTSFSDDGPLDFFVAMTGDMVIRIAGDVTVERGDLLMSAGDGTAKPQDDDIIRSKTIAKVTSTNVSCTYKDGSYCVPCVLMAC